MTHNPYHPAASLISGITDENRHAETRVSPPVPEPEAEGEAVAVYRITKTGSYVTPEPLAAAFDMADGVHDLYTRPSSEAEIADLRARVAELEREAASAWEQGMRDAASLAAQVHEGDPEYRVYADGAEIADEIKQTIRARQALSLAGEEKTGASDV